MDYDAQFKISVTPDIAGERLDSLVAKSVSGCSRSLACQLIKEGKIALKGGLRKPGYKVKSGETIIGVIPKPETITCRPEEIALSVLYEDRDMIVVNKSAGMVVHPAPGNSTGTLANAVLARCPDIEGIGGELRPGIVHRLDKDTSGVIVVAKNDSAHQSIANQFQTRKIEKRYLAIVHGLVETDRVVIREPIGRHPTERKKMSTRSRHPRNAETRWRIRKVFPKTTLLELELLTGRTHQIRVHLAAKGHPIVGDALYTGRGIVKRLARQNTPVDRLLTGVCRQMLHAWKLALDHPTTGGRMHFTAPLPEDLKMLLHSLRSLL
jgi:23S rRNA pseudouridine1911/1915/1917 synthase